jgi:hypothetical protein
MPYCYLVHLSERLGQPRGEFPSSRGFAQHYLGHVTHDLPGRMYTHKHDRHNGSSLLWTAHQRGYTIEVVRVWWAPWPAPWLLEHGLKSLKRAPDLCPVCNPQWFTQGVDYEKLLWKGVKLIQSWRNYVPPSDRTIRRMAIEACHMEVEDAMAGYAPDGQLIHPSVDPFSTWVSDEDVQTIERQIAAEERRQSAIATRRRHQGPPVELPERPYVHIEGEINF